MIRTDMLDELSALTLEDRVKIINFLVESLQKEAQAQQADVPKKRTLGLGRTIGPMWMSDDFDEPLFPEGWMDDPSDPLNWGRSLSHKNDV